MDALSCVRATGSVKSPGAPLQAEGPEEAASLPARMSPVKVGNQGKEQWGALHGQTAAPRPVCIPLVHAPLLPSLCAPCPSVRHTPAAPHLCAPRSRSRTGTRVPAGARRGARRHPRPHGRQLRSQGA